MIKMADYRKPSSPSNGDEPQSIKALAASMHDAGLMGMEFGKTQNGGTGARFFFADDIVVKAMTLPSDVERFFKGRNAPPSGMKISTGGFPELAGGPESMLTLSFAPQHVSKARQAFVALQAQAGLKPDSGLPAAGPPNSRRAAPRPPILKPGR